MPAAWGRSSGNGQMRVSNGMRCAFAHNHADHTTGLIGERHQPIAGREVNNAPRHGMRPRTRETTLWENRHDTFHGELVRKCCGPRERDPGFRRRCLQIRISRLPRCDRCGRPGAAVVDRVSAHRRHADYGTARTTAHRPRRQAASAACRRRAARRPLVTGWAARGHAPSELRLESLPLPDLLEADWGRQAVDHGPGPRAFRERPPHRRPAAVRVDLSGPRTLWWQDRVR